MRIERIYTRSRSGGHLVEQASVRVVAGRGIEGDRYFGRHDEPGQNVTFIEAEEIEAFMQALGRPFDLSLTGRNVVTRGIRLNDLIGREFVAGNVLFRGIELCEPCGGLGRAMAFPGISAAQVVKRMVHRAGLRADALSTGELARGAKLEPATRATRAAPS